MQEDKCSFTYINKSKNNKYKKENVTITTINLRSAFKNSDWN